MNLRSLTLKYLGWCPGVESAARFIPERDVSNKTVIALALSFTSIIIVGLFAAQNRRSHVRRRGVRRGLRLPGAEGQLHRLHNTAKLLGVLGFK